MDFERLDFKYRNNLDDAARRARLMRAICHPSNEASLLLGIAYAASIGGIATPIGTPPNVVLMGIYEETTGLELSFSTWLSFGYPLALGLVAVAWLLLVRSLNHADYRCRRTTQRDLGRASARPISSHERRVLGVFVVTALAWITRKEPFGGWSEFLGITTMGDDSVALAAALAFIIPTNSGSTQKLLDWETAKAFLGTLDSLWWWNRHCEGIRCIWLSNIIGSLLTPLATSPFLVATLLICLVVTFLTEVTAIPRQPPC